MKKEENNIIVSERIANELQAYNKVTGKEAASPLTGVINAGDVAVFSSSLQPRENVMCNSTSCDHICIHEGGCVCASGYAIDSDGKTCTERTTSLWKSFLVSNRTKVCAIPVNLLFSHRYLLPFQIDKSVKCFLDQPSTGSDRIEFLAVDSVNATLYYTVGRSLRRFHILNGSDGALTSASGDILGMAYDWLSGTVVWTQRSPLQAVYGLSQSSATPMVVYQNLKNATHITVDPYRGSMFWIESPRVGVSAQIWSGSINGSEVKRTVLSTGLTRPHDLTYDHKTDKLYWLDVDHIGVIEPDGTQKHIVTLSTFSSYTGLAIIRNYIMWSSANATAKYVNFRNVQFTETDDLTFFTMPYKITDVTDIVFYDASVNLDSGMVSCELDNGGCSQLCIVNGASYHCRCYFGFRLKQDGVTCTSDPVNTNFFLVTDSLSNQIYQIREDNKAVAAVPLQKGARPELVVFNWVTRDIIWYDSQAGAIKLSFLNGSSVRLVRSLREAGQVQPSTVGALCVDHSANTLFFTEIRADNSTGWIRVISLHTRVMKTLYQSEIPPRLLAIAPTRGKLVFGTDAGAIYLSDMNMGNAPTQLESGITKLSGLVFSDGGAKVQWSDDQADSLWRLTLGSLDKERRLHKSGSHPRDLFAWGTSLYYITASRRRLHKSGSHPRDLFAWGTSLYYITASRRTVNTLSSSDIESTVLHFPEFGHLSSVHYYGQQEPPGGTGCSERNGRCSTLCIPAPNSARQCRCADGASLLTDKRTCNNVERCASQIPNGQLSTTCDRFPGESCDYTCQSGFSTNPSHLSISCTSSGQWNPSTDSLCLHKCPQSVPNGQMGSGCPFLAGSACEVTCDAGFSVVDAALPKVTCGQDGKWSVSLDRICKPPVLPLWAIGVLCAGGVGVVAVALGFFCYRRMRKFGGRDSNRQPLSAFDIALARVASQQTTPPGILVTSDLGEGTVGGKQVEEEEKYATLDDIENEVARYESFSKISPNPGKRWRSRSPIPNLGQHNEGFEQPDDYVEPTSNDYSRFLKGNPDDYLTPSLPQRRENSDYQRSLYPPGSHSLYPPLQNAAGYAGSLEPEIPSADYMRVIPPSPQPDRNPDVFAVRKMSRSDWTA
ncbi:hypothetical protein ACOMHN_015429 [Nucella lapillus]